MLMQLSGKHDLTCNTQQGGWGQRMSLMFYVSPKRIGARPQQSVLGSACKTGYEKDVETYEGAQPAFPATVIHTQTFGFMPLVLRW